MLTFAHASVSELIDIVPMLHDLPASAKDIIAAHSYKMEPVAAEQEIIRPGARVESIYAIVYGLIQITRNGWLHSFCGGSTLVGTAFHLVDAPSQDTFTALSECGLLQIRATAFNTIIRDTPELITRLMAEQSRFVDGEINYRNMLLCSNNLGKITATLLRIVDAIRPRLVSDEPDPYTLHWFRQQRFADMLDMERRYVGQALEILRKNDVIVGGRGVHAPLRLLPDPDGRLVGCKERLKTLLRRQARPELASL